MRRRWSSILVWLSRSLEEEGGRPVALDWGKVKDWECCDYDWGGETRFWRPAPKKVEVGSTWSSMSGFM